jgi:hypothetical protein
MTKADAMQILEEENEENKEDKLLILKAGPGMLWLFKRPLDEMIFWRLAVESSYSLWTDCYSLLRPVAIFCNEGNLLIRQIKRP